MSDDEFQKIDSLERECAKLQSQLAAVKEELSKAKAEITRLSGKTGFCGMCESYAKKANQYDEALRRIHTSASLRDAHILSAEALAEGKQ